MKSTKKAFTMIELVFVIVVLGILAAVAVPRLAATRTDAQVTKARADIATIRSGIINERQGRLFRGQSNFIATLDANNGQLFSSIMTYPITAGTTDGHWSQSAATTYNFRILGANNRFDYNAATGTFDCVTASAPSCGILTD